jgi:hypothetical protein
VLYRRRYLSPRAVKQVLGNAFFIGVRRGEGARLGRVAPSDQGSGQVPGKPLQYLGPRPAPTTIVVDGEAVSCGDDSVPSFDRIRYRRHDASVLLYAFDLIAFVLPFCVQAWSLASGYSFSL